MSTRLTNETILEQLKSGTARFELVPVPVPVPVPAITTKSYSISSTNTSTSLFFARIDPTLNTGHGSALKKVERYAVDKVAGDGRCMFRALVKGMARNKGISLTPRQERDDADELRTAVKEVICDSEEERLRYQEAVIAVTVDEPLKRYCQRIGRSDFWGGESELLDIGTDTNIEFLTLHAMVLSKLCHQPIVVYIPENEHRAGGSGFIPIAEYGTEYRKASWKKEPRKVVRLLYSGRNHYDLLV